MPSLPLYCYSTVLLQPKQGSKGQDFWKHEIDVCILVKINVSDMTSNNYIK
jgi:hypothetical protein